MLPESFNRQPKASITPIGQLREYACRVCGKPGESRNAGQAVHPECRKERDKQIVAARKRHLTGLFVQCKLKNGRTVAGVIENDLLHFTSKILLRRIKLPDLWLELADTKKVIVTNVIGVRKAKERCSA